MLPGTQRLVLTPGNNEKRYLAGAYEPLNDRLVYVEGDRKASWIFLNLLRALNETYEDAETIRSRTERTVEGILNGWREEVEALGIEVKGPWLVDFDSGAGYYCWKWPEESLEFFHGYDEGFAGRVPLQ